MRYVLMNWVNRDDAAAYEALSEAEQRADAERHIEWFRRHREHIVGGEELGNLAAVKTLRPGPRYEGVVVSDGPQVETREILGGFVILEVDDEETALAIAREWPSLASQPNATVQLHPVFDRG